MRKKIISFVLAVVMAATLPVSATASSVNTEAAMSEPYSAATHVLSDKNASMLNLDLSLDNELMQADRVWKHFISTKNMKMDAEFDAPQKEAEMFVPEGAKCTEICKIGEVLHIDYQLNDIRYIVSYYQNGEVGKSARAIGSDDYYSIDSFDYVIKHFNVTEDVKVVEISDKEAARRIKLMQSAEWTGDLSYSLDENASRAAVKTVYPESYKDNPNTAPYKAKIVDQGNVRIDAFTGTSYSVYQPYRIYETMSYHTEVKHKVKPFATGMLIRDIALSFIVPMSSAKSWLDYAGVIYDTLNALQEACNVVSDSEYTFLGGKECGIYDPTENKRYVETYASWGKGTITLVWEYNSSTGYNNPTWGHSTTCESLSTANRIIKENGQSAYNSDISMYGVWKWGPGNGFGY